MSPFRPGVPAGLEWNELDSEFRGQTLDQMLFRAANLPFAVAWSIVLIPYSLIHGLMAAMLLPLVFGALLSLFFSDWIPSWLSVATLILVGFSVISQYFAALSVYVFSFLSSVAMTSSVMRFLMVPIVIPLQILWYAIVAIQVSSDYRDAISKGYQLAAIETYPFTNVWRLNRLQQMDDDDIGRWL